MAPNTLIVIVTVIIIRMKGGVDCKPLEDQKVHADGSGTDRFSHRRCSSWTLSDTIFLPKPGVEILPIELWKLLRSHCILFPVTRLEETRKQLLCYHYLKQALPISL